MEADLFVFCELYLTGYMVRDQVHRLAERLDGSSVSKISDLAEEHGCGILFGMAREDDELPGVIKNSAVLVSEDGVQSYDKVHPATFGPFEEGLYFAKGKRPVDDGVQRRWVQAHASATIYSILRWRVLTP